MPSSDAAARTDGARFDGVRGRWRCWAPGESSNATGDDRRTIIPRSRARSDSSEKAGAGYTPPNTLYCCVTVVNPPSRAPSPPRPRRACRCTLQTTRSQRMPRDTPDAKSTSPHRLSLSYAKSISHGYTSTHAHAHHTGADTTKRSSCDTGVERKRGGWPRPTLSSSRPSSPPRRPGSAQAQCRPAGLAAAGACSSAACGQSPRRAR